MKTLSESEYQKILDAANGSTSMLAVEHSVSKNFRSAHYITCRHIVECVTLNLYINTPDKITPTSADSIIKYVRRNNNAFYTSTESMLNPIEDKFLDFARSVTDNADELYSAMRAANFIVYIISLDVAGCGKFSRDEITLRAYSYAELIKKHMI
ncbi:MAG: hypothetical protein J1G04_02470 [Clostridiales bacterium]|nr:hypothetical protein [Clostridiales bacterium]